MKDDADLMDYIERCLKLTPEERLRRMGEMREFFFKHMSPEGRAYLLKTRGIDTGRYEKRNRKNRK